MNYVDIPALEKQIAAEWQRDAAVRDEFCGDYESFKAYKVADAQGLVRVLGRRENRK
jgi:hypothetical protein